MRSHLESWDQLKGSNILKSPNQGSVLVFASRIIERCRISDMLKHLLGSTATPGIANDVIRGLRLQRRYLYVHFQCLLGPGRVWGRPGTHASPAHSIVDTRFRIQGFFRVTSLPTATFREAGRKAENPEETDADLRPGSKLPCRPQTFHPSWQRCDTWIFIPYL